jgi:hypothetical protein
MATSTSSHQEVSYDDINWKSLGEGLTMTLLSQSFKTSEGSALGTLRMFDSAIKGFAHRPEIADRLKTALEDRIELLLAKHLEGAGLSVEEYLRHSGEFSEDTAQHLSEFAQWRYRSVTDEFPGAVEQVVNLTLHHLNASPERVRAQIAASV